MKSQTIEELGQADILLPSPITEGRLAKRPTRRAADGARPALSLAMFDDVAAMAHAVKAAMPPRATRC